MPLNLFVQGESRMDTKRLFVSLALLHLLLFSACSPAATAAPTQPPATDTQAPVATEVAPSDTAEPATATVPATKTRAASKTPGASDGTPAGDSTPVATEGTAAATEGTPVVPVTSGEGTVDPFVGTWTGTMIITPDGTTQEIKITIPADCKKGKKGCGQLVNITRDCTWQLNLSGFEGGALHYKMTTLLAGGCDPAGGSGVLTPDGGGTLVRAHRGPDGLSVAVLTRQAQ
jgi:hypothetical protein